MAKIPDHFPDSHFNLPIQPKIPTPTSFTAKLFSRLKSKIFKESEIPPLIGRIEELHLNSTLIRKELEQIKKEVELDLQPLVLEVIDPMLRNIQKLTSHASRTPHESELQEQTVQKYTQWIDRAKIWVKLYTNAQDKNEVLEAVINHIVAATNQTIENDLSILSQYETQAMASFNQSPEKLHNLRKELHQALKPHLQNLKKLQESLVPDSKNLKEISQWKMEIDELRQQHFNAALHIIDFFAEKYS